MHPNEELWEEDDFTEIAAIMRQSGEAAIQAIGIAPSPGKMNLAGRTPNGQEFIASPQQVWLVNSSLAVVNGVDVNEFLIPQRLRYRS